MSELPFDAPRPDPLRGETVVFTGRLWSLGRKEASALVERLGGVCDEDVTLRTTMLVVGADSHPEGAPDLATLAHDATVRNQKLRRAAQINAEQPGRVRVLGERAFCRHVGLPDVQDLRAQHYGQKDVLAMYPLLREDHLRYLEKWGFIKPAFRNNADTWYGFTDLTTLRQLHTALQQGGTFRSVLRDMQSARSGQLAFDFRIEAHQARIVELGSRRRMAQSQDTAPQMSQRTQMEAWLNDKATSDAIVPGASSDRPLSPAEQSFLMGSLLDDGTPQHVEEAALAYRRALDEDPDLVAAIINLANIRYAKDELAEAQALYERAIGLDPTYFEAYFNLGNIHHDHGRYLDAEACYREALGLNATYADAHFYLAVTLEKMGRSADARPHWRAYQRLAPTGEWIELAREFSD
jgi:tetratricopeptide (TPR) repeat protein